MEKRVSVSQSPVTTVSSVTNFVPRSESVAERIDKWYIMPLRKMSGSQVFIVLMVLLPLYEKHLRVKYGYGANSTFSKGHPVFKIMGKQLHLDVDSAFLFWSHVRNGLLHHGLPKEAELFKYGIRSDGPSIEREGNLFWINPFAMRDQLLQEIEPDIRTWKEDDVPLPITHTPIQSR